MATAMDRAASQRSERINLRVAPEVEAVLREAAALRHKTLSAFLLDAAYEQAQATIEEGRRLRVRTETFERLLDELDRPAEVVEPLLELVKRVRSDA